MATQAYEGWLREENLEPFLRLVAELCRIPVDVGAALDGTLDSDPVRGRWYEVPGADPVSLRLGLEPGTGIVELRVVPTALGADAVVERLRVLCAVTQSWSLSHR